MKIVYEPIEFEEVIRFLDPYDGICTTDTNTFPSIDNEPDKTVLFNCPVKIIYYPESYDDVDFKLPISIRANVNIRRILKYYNPYDIFYMRNIKSHKWDQYRSYDPMCARHERAILDRGIKRAQKYPDDKLGEKYESPQDELFYKLLTPHGCHSFDILNNGPNPDIMVTGRYEIYYTRFGLESKHRFIDIIVEDTLIKEK